MSDLEHSNDVLSDRNGCLKENILGQRMIKQLENIFKNTPKSDSPITSLLDTHFQSKIHHHDELALNSRLLIVCFSAII